jgi:hypothetical protein
MIEDRVLLLIHLLNGKRDLGQPRDQDDSDAEPLKVT